MVDEEAIYLLSDLRGSAGGRIAVGRGTRVGRRTMGGKGVLGWIVGGEKAAVKLASLVKHWRVHFDHQCRYLYAMDLRFACPAPACGQSEGVNSCSYSQLCIDISERAQMEN